jgi:hypothetical protein
LPSLEGYRLQVAGYTSEATNSVFVVRLWCDRENL